MRFKTGPSVWLEFTPLSQLTSSINLGQGAPGWGSPAFLKDALVSAARADEYSQYAPPVGANALVNVIAQKYASRLNPICNAPENTNPNDVPYKFDARTQVIVTDGASQALSLACTALLSPGDEVILLEPAFDIYFSAVCMAEGVPISVPLRLKAGIRGSTRDNDTATIASSADIVLDIDQFISKLSSRTRMLILNSPHNPTGKVFSRSELNAISEALDAHAPNCIVLSDEVYEHIVYDKATAPHIPFASISRTAHDRTVSVYSTGKTFSATGLKVGWAIGPAPIIKEMQLAQQYTVFCVNHLSQIAIADALSVAENPYNGRESYYEWLVEFYRRKRDVFVQTLQKAGFEPIVPQGAFYVCAHVPPKHPARRESGLPEKIKKLKNEGLLIIDEKTAEFSDYNISRNLVLQFGVASIPNSAFFSDETRGKDVLSRNYVRFAFCHEDDVLSEADRRLMKREQ